MTMAAMLKRLCQPTLQRRMLLALMLVFVLIWPAVLLYNIYSSVNTDEREQNVKRYAELMAVQMERQSDAGQLVEFVANVERFQNAAYASVKVPMKLVLNLWDKQGQLLFGSEQAKPPAAHGVAGQIVWNSIDGRPFAVFRLETRRWDLVVAMAYADTGWVAGKIAKGLLPDFLIAFVLALPVLWLALRRGLLPLRELSNRIAARDPEDLSGTGIQPRYGELKPLQQALDGLLAKLRSKVARETAFVQEAAHELRTPMALISAQAHILALEQNPAARREAEQRLDRALERASHLVGQLLQLAQMDATRSLQAIDLDLAHETRAELAMLVGAARQRNIELSLHAPDAMMAHLERETYESILHNLVGNAIRYVEPNGRIEVSLAQQAGHIVLSVADNGPGIPADQREQVFERFHRGAEHTASGTGLGLAIVKQACARLGGTVRLQDGLDGRGCMFVVELPAPVAALAPHSGPAGGR